LSAKKVPDSSPSSPFDTEDLRKQLTAFLDTPFPNSTPSEQVPLKIGAYKWGVYAFFDYDDEPIYVGQTKEKLSTRIRRHLTNQRTDAVAMSVLDPFEVYKIKVWPLPQFQATSAKDAIAKTHLNALERKIYDQVVTASRYGAVLNEKDPPVVLDIEIATPASYEAAIVSDEIYKLRSHPDSRLARRASVIARLAQVIAERKVQGGLRRVLATQAKRLHSLAQIRYEALGGAASVEKKADGEDGDD